MGLAQLAQDLWLVSTKSLPFRTRTLRTRSTRAEPCLGPSALGRTLLFARSGLAGPRFWGLLTTVLSRRRRRRRRLLWAVGHLRPSATGSPTSLSLRLRARRERLRTLPLTSTTTRRAPTSSRPRPTRRAALPPPRVPHRGVWRRRRSCPQEEEGPLHRLHPPHLRSLPHRHLLRRRHGLQLPGQGPARHRYHSPALLLGLGPRPHQGRRPLCLLQDHRKGLLHIPPINDSTQP